MKPRAGSLKWQTKVTKLATHTKQKRDIAQINKTRNERWGVTTEDTKFFFLNHETTMNNYSPIKWTTYKKMDKFLEIYNFLRLNHEEIENLNKPIISKDIESVIIFLNPPNKQMSSKSEVDGFTCELYQSKKI